MMTPIETQPTVAYSVAMSLPGTSSAAGAAAEAGAAGLSVVTAVNTDDGKARLGEPVGHQQHTIAEAYRYPPTSGQGATAEMYLQQQQQQQSQPPPSYAAALQLQQQQQRQQPTTSASATYPSDGQVVTLAPGLAATNAAAATIEASTNLTVWMPKPLVTTRCPPGLEYLAELSQLNFLEEMPMNLSVEQIWSMQIAPRRYSVRNAQGQQIYIADTSRNETAWDPILGFVDSTGQVLMTITMKRNACPICCTGKCGRCLLDVTVEAPPGVVVSTVEQRLSGGNVLFVIKNTEGSPVLYLEGPNPCSFCVDCNSWLPNTPYRPFAIRSLDRRQQIGKIEAQPTFFMSYDERLLTNVAIAFPADLDVTAKAAIAGGAMMLHRYFYGIHGGSNTQGSSSHNRQIRPFNSTFHGAPNSFHHHHGHFSHHAGYSSRTTGHFSTSRSSHHSSHTSHHRSGRH